MTEIEKESRRAWAVCEISELDQDTVEAFVEKIIVWDEKKAEIEWKFRESTLVWEF